MSLSQASAAAPLRLLVLFAGFFLLLQWSYEQASGGPVETVVIDYATVKPAAYLIRQLAPELQVRAVGHQLLSSNSTLSVLNGCEGTESLFLIIAAIAAYKSRWRHKLLGMVLATALIFVTNQARIVALYFALQNNRALFNALHSYIAPTLIIAVAAGFYLWWIRWVESASQV
ncbi:MAG: archaeosortase/exosortase family protein [Gammaproteobacteria bacterium]|nr:archaeosortase/exosortase family protein [Gammaproteobacteria bacterium]MBQ0839809.1 archaeosortase/exosortase family protein [Gammaproteobacteria bacterium]